METENFESSPLNSNSSIQDRESVGYTQLFRFAEKFDYCLIAIGVVASLVNGACMPMFALVFGEMANSFQTASPDEVLVEAGYNSLYFLIIGLCTFVASFFMISMFLLSGERQGVSLRKHYFKALLKQEVGWYDSVNVNEINSKVATEAYLIQDAICEKLGTFIMAFSTFLSGILIGYIKGWLLALVITAAMPVLALSILIIAAVSNSSASATSQFELNASAYAEQALNAIKTVKMLDGEEFECLRYHSLLTKCTKTIVKYSIYQGLALGLIFGTQIWAYGLGFWYGAKLISDQTINDNANEPYTAGDVMTIFFSILMGSFSLGNFGPCLQSFGKGQVAAAQAFKIIDRKPTLFTKLNTIKLQNSFNGEITFENVEFTYPARPESKVLNRINLRIPPGLKVALVGESGCGKSTILQLIERFYDCGDGQVLIGNERIDVKDVDLVEYRSQIGMVGQEPVLFAASIRENLLFGKTDATESEMIEALKKVNAWEFVEKMEKGLETYVGIGGSQLSGGQKQRIAIARAILKKPKVLLLDEATSALDRANEKLIQSTLDEVSKGITTIVIAHRLSTIQNADIIYVFEKGVIVEQGTHQELINKGGKYESLAKNQLSGGNQQITLNQDQDLNVKQEIENQNEKVEVEVGSQLNPFLNQQNIVGEVIQSLQDIQHIQKMRKVADEKEQDAAESQAITRLFLYNRNERGYLIAGIVSAAINGCVNPIFSIFLSDLIAILIKSNPNLYENDEVKAQKAEEVQQQADFIGLIMLLLGFLYMLFSTTESVCLTICAERLTMKLRGDTFAKLLRMPAAYFDEPKNNAGTLTARLSVDCKILQGLTSNVLGFRMQSYSALICGLSIAFTSSWALTLIALAIGPISAASKILRAKYFKPLSKENDEAYKDSGNLVMEAVTNIRAVYSFGNEEVILQAYDKKIKLPLDHSKRNAVMSGLTLGITQMQLSIINALIFYLGAVLIRYDGLSVQDMYRTIFGITFAVMGGSKDSQFANDIDKSKKAAVNIFALLDQIDEFQIESSSGSKRLQREILGNIEFKEVSFKYASRNKLVLDHLCLQIPSFSKVAFVGPSGCGKSTIMQMLMRFYDPESGEILLDGINIKDYDIRYLRKQLAIVSQEPVLFNGTISENIRYNQQSTQQQIEEAAKQANAYDFIVQDKFELVDQRNMDFGTGFSKLVGPKGSQISGGQKQRIAIARAILRNANILLLDEATSALDSQSEEIVQDSLNRFMQNKTSLSIAHRISTIRDSDIIYVFEDGKIVEQGDYKTLIGYKQFFYRLEQGITQ